MKIAAMVGAPDLETDTLAVYSGDFAGAFARLAELGYDAVEIMTRDPSRLDSESLRAQMSRDGLELAGVCTGHVFGEERLGLVGPDKENCAEAMRRLKAFVDFSASFPGKHPLINIGRARGPGFPNDVKRSLDEMVEAFRELAEYAEPKKVSWILEPVNNAQTNFIHSTHDGVEIVRRVNRSNFGLMLDVYHMNIEDEDIDESIQEARDVCWFVHFADNERKWPGAGNIPFERIVESLRAIGYDGYVSLEILPWPDGDTAAKRSIEYLRRFIPK